MLIFHSSFTWKHWIGLVLTSVAYAIPYQQLAGMAKPAYADDGELLDGGFDMSTGGICGYVCLFRVRSVWYFSASIHGLVIISVKCVELKTATLLNFLYESMRCSCGIGSHY